MFRTTAAKAYLKRNLRVLYGWTQATPKSLFLDPAWDRSVPIWPGMVAARTSGDQFTLIGPGMVPLGFISNFIGGDGIDELLDQGINASSVWVLAPDAEMEVLAPAFDTALSWVDPGDGTEALIYASTSGANRGKLVPAGTANASTSPVARLLKVNSATKITVGGLR